jgi:hypothetical protein
MPKKCISAGGGVFCIENMTLFVLILLSISVGYLYYVVYAKPRSHAPIYVDNRITSPPPTLQNMYIPPLNTIDIRGPPPQGPLGIGIPVNIRTSTANTPYRQIGILTRNAQNSRDSDPLILPLFGRNLLNGRDKWQYYTMSNSSGASFNAKLPISVNGRSCTGEYGCDGIYNGDTVYVEGYEDTFRATIYENATMSYIPL